MKTKLISMRKSRKKGFTLIELIVVIAILAILAMLAVPAYTGLQTNAEQTVANANARTVYTAARAVEALGDTPSVTNVNNMLVGTGGAIEGGTFTVSGTGATLKIVWSPTDGGTITGTWPAATETTE